MSEAAPLVLPDTLREALIAEARDAHNVEICGLIGSTGDRVPTRYPIVNRAKRAVDRFDMDPAGQITAFKQMRERCETLIAIYHSHPIGEATPSIHDRRGHSYPAAAAVIVAPNARAGDLIRAWDLAGEAPVEIPIA